MYVSSEKSANLEPLVLQDKQRKSTSSIKRFRKQSKKSAKATETTNSGEQKEDKDVAGQTLDSATSALTKAASIERSPTLAIKASPQVEGEVQAQSNATDKETPPTGGNVDTPGTLASEEARQDWADQDFSRDWTRDNTPATRSTVDTPRNGSSSFLLSSKPNTATTSPQCADLEQGWVTAAVGQDGMDVSMEQGQVDGDPALQLHSEGNDPAWNAVQLQAGEECVDSAKEATADPTVDRVVNVVVWFGPQDPANPLNWSHAKRAFVTAQIYLLTLCTYIGTSIFSPGSENLQAHFGVGQVAATLGTSLAILGYGLGVMIWSPLSEAIRFGRKPVYLATLAIFVGLQVPTALAKHFGTLLAFRFLSGIFGAPVLAIGGASINDMYPPTQRGYAIFIWDVVSTLAPVLGPLVGGFAADANGWRWTIWILMWFSGGSLILFIFFMPETNQSNILYRRTRRLRVLTGNKTLMSEQGVLGGQLSLTTTIERLFARPFVLSFTEPILLVINIYIALLNAILFGSLDSFPLVFKNTYGFNLGEVGLAFLGLSVGSVLALPPMLYYLRFGLKGNQSGEVKPEKRLPPAIVGVFLAPISLFIFGWTARTDVHWIVPIAGSGIFGIAIVLISYATLNYLPDAYPSMAASVLAGNECMRSTASAVFPLFTTAMYTRLGTGWASSLLAMLACAFIPVPIVLYYYGHVIRSWSKRAKQDF